MKKRIFRLPDPLFRTKGRTIVITLLVNFPLKAIIPELIFTPFGNRDRKGTLKIVLDDYNEVRKQVILRALESRSDILIPALNIAEL